MGSTPGDFQSPPPPLSLPLLRAEALSRRYGRQVVVHDLGFSLHRGEVLGLLGRNGAGKSTVMQMISGVLAPSSGTVEIVGHSLLKAGQEARRHIGFLPQPPPLYLDLTVDEYLCFAARLRGMQAVAIPPALHECKSRCGLLEYGGQLLEQLSEGYRQRVGIAQAIIHKPALIILDEPTIALDPLQTREIHSLIRALSEGHGIIFSTHILSEVQTLCDRVLILHRGRMVLNQPMRELQRGVKEVTRVAFSFQAPPATAMLRALRGVADVRKESEHRYLVQYRPGLDATDAILEAALKGGWKVHSCEPEESHLEAVFTRLALDLDVAIPEAEEVGLP